MKGCSAAYYPKMAKSVTITRWMMGLLDKGD